MATFETIRHLTSLTLKRHSNTGRGTLGAHDREKCPETMRTAEISTAGQSAWVRRSSRSGGRTHETRPKGRVACPGRSIPLTPLRVAGSRDRTPSRVGGHGQGDGHGCGRVCAWTVTMLMIVSAVCALMTLAAGPMQSARLPRRTQPPAHPSCRGAAILI